MEGRTTSSNAVTTALERARRHRGSAAAAALLAPLALGAMTSPAAATTTGVSISGSTSTAGPVTTFTYNVSNLTGLAPLYQFELPELNAGDFNLGSFSGPVGWSAAETATSQYSTTRFKDASLTPGAYVLIADQFGAAISEGSSRTFSLSTTTPGTLDATFSYSEGFFNPAAEGFVQLTAGSADPPVPGTAPTSVPEPASIGLLGIAATLALIRRRRS